MWALGGGLRCSTRKHGVIKDVCLFNVSRLKIIKVLEKYRLVEVYSESVVGTTQI